MASFLTASHWIVAVPDPEGSTKVKADAFRNRMVEMTGKTLAEISVFEAPRNLKVGTIDSLTSVSEDAARSDGYVEGVVKKVERQVAESYMADKLAELARLGREGGAGVIEPLKMYVPGAQGPIAVHTWASQFRWDATAWGDSQDSLPDILRRLQSAAEKIDADIRVYAQAYQERKAAYVAAERKKSGNLMVAALEDIITPEALKRAGAEFIPSDSEYLSSVVVVIQKAQEQTFLETYSSLDEKSVPLGPEGRREAVRGSPVVPGSARRIAEDKDGYVLYTVLILKKFADTFRTACREKRFIVREFEYDPANSGSISREVAERSTELASALAQLKTESRRKYGEATQIWFHVKAVRVFAESVLRYGLPVRFAAVLFRIVKGPNGGGSQEVASKLLQTIMQEWKSTTGGASAMDQAFATPGAKGGAPVASDMLIPGVSDAANAASQPFVFLDFDIKVDTSQLSK